MSGEARVPRFKMGLEDEHARPIEPDWSVVVSNQFTEITQNTVIIENQKQMIAELQKIIELWDQITKRQSTMVDAIGRLSIEIDKARTEVRSSMMSIIQVPITVVIIGAASLALLHEIHRRIHLAANYGSGRIPISWRQHIGSSEAHWS